MKRAVIMVVLGVAVVFVQVGNAIRQGEKEENRSKACYIVSASGGGSRCKWNTLQITGKLIRFLKFIKIKETYLFIIFKYYLCLKLLGK